MVHVNTWVLTYNCTESSTKEVLLRPGRSRCPGKSMETIFGCRGINCNHRTVQRGTDRGRSSPYGTRSTFMWHSQRRDLRDATRIASLSPLQIAEASPNDFMVASALWSLGQRSSGLHTLSFFFGHLRYFLGVRRNLFSRLGLFSVPLWASSCFQSDSTACVRFVWTFQLILELLSLYDELVTVHSNFEFYINV